MYLLITCEHGGNHIPSRWKSHFADAEQALNSHRGYDPGALELAKDIAKQFKAPLIASTTSRLLVELNRSLYHPKLFSAWTRMLSPQEKETILREFYLPYRTQVEKVISTNLPVLHLSIHSFTPELEGEIRQTEIGLLYDPGRRREKQFATAWKQALRKRVSSSIRVRANYPYLGKADGFTTFLRTKWKDFAYIGIELEINQKIVHSSGQEWQEFKQIILQSLHDLIVLN
ncbi:MAG: hypothetical protein CK425_02820 [Parachlamydia sp.]|nr:MAG: hypothetical protein CK425_02820 [Parachlamydia sp.]